MRKIYLHKRFDSFTFTKHNKNSVIEILLFPYKWYEWLVSCLFARYNEGCYTRRKFHEEETFDQHSCRSCVDFHNCPSI